MTRWDGDSNEGMHERCGMGACVNGVEYGMVEWVKSNILMWFGHTVRIETQRFVKKSHFE